MSRVESEPVKITLTCHLHGVDAEAELLSCAAQLFGHGFFRDITTPEERARVGRWLSARLDKEERASRKAAGGE